MKSLLRLDWIAIISVLLLSAISLLALFSVSSANVDSSREQFYRQIISVVLGLILMFFFAAYDYRTFNFYSTRLYVIALIVLMLVFFFGTTVRGTTGWLGIWNFHIQPVEIVKLIMIIFLASFLSKKKTELSTFVRIVVAIVLAFIPVFLILQQPDFGSAAIIIIILIGMLLVSGVNKKSLAALAIILLLAGLFAAFFLKDYQKGRLVSFIKPGNDPRGSGYNVIQSTVAVGSGGIWGRGLGHGSQSQLNFLPEKHTDFIFAVIAEELGLIGSTVIFILFGVLFYRMKEIARMARDNFGYLLSVGVIIMLFVQFFINVGMNIGVVPVAGVPLPLLSYGGSSLLTTLASVGILESIYVRRNKVLD